VPASGVSAVVLNVTAARATAQSFFTAWLSRPLASNLNYVGGQTVDARGDAHAHLAYPR
jgi:hypothetical protein